MSFYTSQIPLFNPGLRYTFFEDLTRETNNPQIDLQKRALYRHAYGYYNGLFRNLKTNTVESASNIIMSAIDFLGGAATSERAKEIHAVEYYLEDLMQQIPDKIKRQRSFKQIIDDLKKISNQISTSVTSNSQKDIDNFYIELTTYINMIRSNIEDFLARVKQIKNNNITEQRELKARSTVYRMTGDLNTLFKSISGTESKNLVNSFASRTRNIVSDYIINNASKLISNIDIRAHFPALLAGMLIDFERYVEHDRNLNDDVERALDKIRKSDLENLFKKYIKECDTYFLKQFSNYVNDKNTKEFINSLKRFEKATGLEYMNSKSSAAQEQLQVIERYSKPTPGGRNHIANMLKQSTNLSDIADMTQFLTWSIDTSDRSKAHGTIYEAIQDLLFGAMRIGGTPATDNIAIGKLKGEFNEELMHTVIQDKLEQMSASIRDTVIQEREDRLQDYSDALSNTIDELSNLENTLASELSALNNVKIEDIFIFHESLKLYSTMEITEDGQRRSSKFHGREIQAFSALDNLYTMQNIQLNNTNLIELPDADSLYGLILNLSDLAVAHSSHGVVEDYLSIFAGLLLFSDIRDMAVDLAQQAQRGVSYANPTKVHLYLLNDTYVPGSMILTYVYQTLRQGFHSVSIKDGAKATINTDAASGTISSYLSARDGGQPYSLGDWPVIANQIASNTKIQINFLSSYVTFIKNIAHAI